jgi:hypothetical protein
MSKLITATTEALNALGSQGALEDEHHYIRVQLCSTDGRVVGEWLDEHDATAWEFAPVDGSTP